MINEQTIFNFALNTAQIDAILRHLDLGAHREVRPTIDVIMAQYQAQVRKIQEDAKPETAPASPEVAIENAEKEIKTRKKKKE